MLSIRTTMKPDVGASPADLVYGEGLAVPGESLPSTPASDAQLFRQRAAALADLRLEVARLQPVQTSAHRTPLVHMPDNLETCTHVFVRRGGVQWTLSSPYAGPFKVLARNNLDFKVSFPGRAHKTVAISRIKPAFSSMEDADAAQPPPRPQQQRRGRRPRHPRPPPRNAPRDASPPPHPPPVSQPQSPTIGRRPRGRARQLSSEDEAPPSPPPV